MRSANDMQMRFKEEEKLMEERVEMEMRKKMRIIFEQQEKKKKEEEAKKEKARIEYTRAVGEQRDHKVCDFE
jgi:hypothetical protein